MPFIVIMWWELVCQRNHFGIPRGAVWGPSSGSQRVVRGSAAAGPLGSLLYSMISGTIPDLLNQKSDFNKIPWGFVCMLKFEKHWHRELWLFILLVKTTLFSNLFWSLKWLWTCQNLLEQQHIAVREVFICGGDWLLCRSQVTPNINSFWWHCP